MNTPTKEELGEAIAYLKDYDNEGDKKHFPDAHRKCKTVLTILTKYRDGQLVEIMGDTKPNPIDPIEHATWYALREFKRLPIEQQLKLFKEFKGVLTPPTNQTEKP